MGFLDVIKQGAASIVDAGSAVIDEVQDIRGQKRVVPPKPTPIKTISEPAPSIPITPAPSKTITKVVEKPTYIQAPPEVRYREMIQPPADPKVSYTQDVNQWRTPEYEEAQREQQQIQQEYTQNPVYEAGVEDIQSNLEQERVAMEAILGKAHDSYEKLKDVSQFEGYWEDKSTGSKVMAGIGLLFGAMGQGMHGKKNVALEILLKNIDRDSEIKEKRIVNQLRKVNYSKAGAQIKAKKIEQLQQQLNDLSLGKPYAVAAARAAALAKKTGNPLHQQASDFIDQSLALKNITSKVEDLKNLKQQSTMMNYANQEQAPRSTITSETITGKMLRPVLTRSNSGGNKPLTPAQEFTQEDKLRKSATSGAFGKAFSYASNFERFRIKLKTMLNSKSPYDHYNILLEAAKMLQGDNSVVRDPEMRAFMSSTNFENTLRNWVNNWTHGTKFEPTQIRDLYGTIQKGSSVSARQYKKMIRPILNAADKIGVPHENVYSKDALYMTDEEVRAEYKRRKGLK